jgi:predicted MPP superfamily phosphohydrolase
MNKVFGWKRKALAVGLTFLLVVFGLVIWVFLIEPNRLVSNHDQLVIDNWPSNLSNLRVAAIADIHAGSPFIDEDKLREIVATTNANQPEIIVLLGDYVVGEMFYRNPIEPERIAAALRGFKAPLGVFAVLGNHDWWHNGIKVRQAFESAGIKVLENESLPITRNGETFWLVGLADAWTRPQNISGVFASLPAGATSITLTHNPDVFPLLPPGAHLTLAGHTHGGQVNLPFLGRRVVPSEYGDRYAAGHVQEAGKDMYVTTGIGTSIIPVRFRVPPEIAILTIKSP